MSTTTGDTEVTYRVRITPKLVYAILGPYYGEKIREQITALIPIAGFLFLFQLIVIREGVTGSLQITAGLMGVVVGLMFFMDGIRFGLMPLGENIGATLPLKAGLWLILGFGFILGTATTYAEPAIATLQAAGGSVRPQDSALLYEMLNDKSAILVASVAIGVGFATALGVYRFVRHWSLKLLLMPTIAVVLPLTVIAELNPDTRGITALAWDAGAVTTGSVTVPLVLALGIGVTRVLGKSETGMGGFGIVTLASLWPVTTALIACFAVFYLGGGSAGDLGALAGAADEESLAELFASSMRASLQAIIPLVGFLYLVQRFVLKEPLRHVDQIALGIVFAVIGLLLFNVGLGRGLIPLGEQVGGNVPSAFAPPDELYGATGGRVIAIVFAFIAGYGATLAEPALNALSQTVEDVTAGAFKKWLLAQAVAVGVGLGLALGLAQIIFDWPITYLVVPGYVILAAVTLLSDEKYVNIGWDSAGVTTGEITVPLVLAMGLGVGTAVGVPDGFGMLTMASIGPILTVLVLGLVIVRTTPTPDEVSDRIADLQTVPATAED